MRVHIDTDFGGDPDDACALAMLLGWWRRRQPGLAMDRGELGGLSWAPLLYAELWPLPRDQDS